MKFTEAQLEAFSAPLSDTEQQKCIHAISMVRDALKDLGFSDNGKPIGTLYTETYAYAVEMRSPYGGRKIKLFIQGSYANNTNVRTQSDVDIAVIQEEAFRTHYRSADSYSPQSDSDYGFGKAPTPAKAFKDEVERCLKDKFGNDVERKNKSIKIHGNTYRKDADTVPCRRYRDYSEDYLKKVDNYIGGVVIYADDGEIIINYPEQHIQQGKSKNARTKYWYKKMVRIMKTMRYLMEDRGYTEAKEVSSFALESLLWNIPDDHYVNNGMYTKTFHFQQIINYLQSHSSEFDSYKEANAIKPLFASTEAKEKMIKFLHVLSAYFYQH